MSLRSTGRGTYRRLLMAALFAAAACSPDKAAPPEVSAGSSATSKPANAPRLPEITPTNGFPAKVNNFNGHTALLASKPMRILAGNASLLEGLIELLEPERMAALPSTAFSYSILKEEPGRWSELPLMRALEEEAVLQSQADLLIVHAYQASSTLERVIEHDVPVVYFPIASSWKEIVAGLNSLARLVGEEERAAILIADLELRRKVLQARAPRTGLRVLPYGQYGVGGTTAGAGTTWQLMIELAGMRNAAGEAGMEGYPKIEFEQLLAIDPDYFLVSESEEVEGQSAEALLLSEPSIANLRAVRDRRFLRLPEFLYTTASHHLLTAAERIAVQADALLAQNEGQR